MIPRVALALSKADVELSTKFAHKVKREQNEPWILLERAHRCVQPQLSPLQGRLQAYAPGLNGCQEVSRQSPQAGRYQSLLEPRLEFPGEAQRKSSIQSVSADLTSS